MRKLETGLALALAASVVIAFSFWYQLREERSLNELLRAREPDATHPTPSTPVSATAGTAEVSPAPSAVAVTDSTLEEKRTVTGRREDQQAYQRQLLKDPRYVAALRDQRRLNYRLRRDNAMRLFGFSRETADAIIDLDIDREMQMMALDPSAAGDDMHRQYEALQGEHDAKMLGLLGQDRFDRWQSYMETRGTRMQVDRFRAQLNGADALREDQVEPLITALAAEQKQMQADVEEYHDSLSWEGDSTDSNSKFRTRQIELIRAAHKRMLSSAGSILSASQVQRLAEMLKADVEQRATLDRMESLRQKLGSVPDTDAGSD